MYIEKRKMTGVEVVRNTMVAPIGPYFSFSKFYEIQ